MNNRDLQALTLANLHLHESFIARFLLDVLDGTFDFELLYMSIYNRAT